MTRRKAIQISQNIYMVGSGEIGLSAPLDCHWYLVDGGSEYLLVDAGAGEASVAALDSMLELHGLDRARITTLLLTHWHLDHANGARDLQAMLGCRVWAPAGEREFIEAGRDGVKACRVDHSVEHGEEISVGSLRLIAYTVPGHSEASTAYLLETSSGRSLFCGDILFANGLIGLINYPGSDLQQYRTHIERLRDLEVDSLLPGHGLFTLRNGQRHIDLAIRRLRENMFVPASIGQYGVSFLPPSAFEV